MALNGVSTYTKPHGSGKSESGGGRGIQIINRYGGSNINPANLNVTNLSAYKASIDNLTAKNGDIDNCTIRYLMSPTGEITKLEGNDLNYKYGHIAEIMSDSIETNKITAHQEGNIKNLISDFIQANNITTDNLTVTKSAHFFELIVDKIRSVQGTQINTAANCVADYVEGYHGTYHNYRDTKVDVTSNNVDYFRVYWKNNDDNGKTIKNEWLSYDQAICQSFGVDAGISQNVQNKYYWRLVEKTDEGTPKYVNFATGQVRNAKPDFNITIARGFGYGYSYSYNYIPFTVRPQATGEWTSYAYTYSGGVFSPHNTIYGLEVTLDADDPRYLCGGDLVFDTDIDTMLNVGVYYNDGTFEYTQADTYKKRYVIPTANEKNVEAFIINAAVIDQWDACNWIDLSNDDMDATLSGVSAIPSAGDNICQLGYRYDMLQNPTQDDISRASAIIIAAYKTPDIGIVPPSYAQYQRIGSESSYRWNLGHYRGSYFDSIKAKFIGEFEVQAGGSTTPLDDYIKSFNNANPLEGFISTNNNQPVDLIVLQTDNSNKIYDLNNFPNNLQVMVTNEGSPQFDISDYDTLTLTMFGVTYDLLEANNYTPNLPSGYQGIYVSNIIKGAYQPFSLSLAFAGSEQTVITSSVLLNAEISNGNDTYILNKSIPVNSVSSVEGTDAEVWQLFSDTEICEVISSNDSNNGKLQWLFRYGLIHIVGTTASFSQGTSGMYVIVKSYNSSGQEIDSYMDVAPFTHSGGKAGEYYCEFGGGIPTDWWSLTDLSEREMYFIVQLFNSNNECLDSKTVPVIIQPTGLFHVEEGLTQLIQANTTAIQAANGDISGLQTNYSTLTQTVNGINTTVSQQQVSISNLNSSVSQIDQKADSIDLRVTQTNTDLSNLETDLQTTGIDITNGTIELRANKVTFTDSTGTINNKISIDPTTGTLNAVDGNFSGTINANNGQFGPNDEVFNLTLNADAPSFKLNGCKYVKCDTNSNVIYPYKKYDSSTLENFQYIDISCSNWTNSNIPAGSTYGSIGLDPTITLRTPYAGYNSSTDDYYSEMQISPNRGLEFYNKINGTKNVNGVISNNGIYINGSLGLGQTFVLLNNFSNNTAARNAGLNIGDVYHTNGTLKVVV